MGYPSFSGTLQFADDPLEDPEKKQSGSCYYFSTGVQYCDIATCAKRADQQTFKASVHRRMLRFGFGWASLVEAANCILIVAKARSRVLPQESATPVFAAAFFVQEPVFLVCSFEKLVKWSHCSSIGWDRCAHPVAGPKELLQFCSSGERTRVYESFQAAGVELRALGGQDSVTEICLLEKELSFFGVYFKPKFSQIGRNI